MKSLLYCLSIFLFISCQNDVENQPNSILSNETNDEVETATPDESEIAETSIPMDLGLRSIEAVDLPNLDYDGNFTDCWTWDDKNGENYLLRTIEEPKFNYPEEDGWETYDQSLHVYHYSKLETGETILLRDLTDFIKDCEFDLIMNHLEPVELSDIDNDNYGEIIFGYRLHCTSDVSPSSQKVLLFENGDKYILRGTSVAMGYGGEYTPGDEFNSGPEGFLEKAKNYWEENKVEYALEPNEY